MRKNATKKALFLSLISTLLCVSMFVGSTFAWFTDTASSGVNKIVAGNLDIKVSYLKNDGSGNFADETIAASWKDLEGSKTLFSKNMWEPGHTEVVYLKVENMGSLAFNYKMNVSPINEIGGINVAGENFKLSDYLVFKTSAALDACPDYTRDDARSFAGTTRKLNQEGLSESGSMLKGDPAQYFALVVYMPEEVGNEANYKTGTTAPEIDLCITFVATQKTEEFDSFGNDYDDAAVNEVYQYIAGPTYVYFPQVNQTAAITKTATGAVTLDNVPVSGDKVIIESTAKVEGTSDPAVIFEIPFDALDTGATNPGIEVAKSDAVKAAADAAKAANKDIAAFEISTVGLPKTGGRLNAAVTVSLFVGKNLDGVVVYHKGAEMTSGVTYDATSGYVIITSDSFSPFGVLYNKVAARIGTTLYGSIDSAIDAYNKATEQKAYTISIFDGTYKESDMVIYQKPTLPGKSLIIKTENAKSVTIKCNDDSQTDRIFLISGMSSYNGGAVTIDGIKFDISNIAAGKTSSAIYLAAGGSGNPDTYITDGASHRYAHDVTIKNCEFVGNGKEDTKALESPQNSSSAGIVIENCVGTNLGYLAEGYYHDVNTSKIGLTVKGCTVTGTKALINNQAIASTTVVENCTVTAYHDYIVRSNGNIDVKNSNFTSTYADTVTGGIIVCRSIGKTVTVVDCTFTKASTKMSDVYNATTGDITFNGSTLAGGVTYNFAK